MNVQQRIDLLVRLGAYILSDDEGWMRVKQRAEQANKWFTQQFIHQAVTTIAGQFLEARKLIDFVRRYDIPAVTPHPRTVGLVMAGNIPLVGFHDWLCIFLAGHRINIKTSSKDEILIKHLIVKLREWNDEINDLFQFPDLLKGCDAYIATGSNNTARYFEYYFARYPSIIRKNRTSIAMLTGYESSEELDRLADDVHMYFGLGCRNVTKLYVPGQYDFIPLLDAFKKYAYLGDHHKYKNNYDYQLAIYMLNNQYFMTSGSALLIEDSRLFSPISQVNYEFYASEDQLIKSLGYNNEVQCIVGSRYVPFGEAQSPSLTDYADGTDTMEFALGLHGQRNLSEPAIT